MRAAWLVVGLLSASACSSGTPPSGNPAPQPAATPKSAERPPSPAAPGGAAVLYRPITGSGYRLERRDSLTLELPGGGTQLQEFVRTAYLTVGIAEAPDGYHTTIRLDSLHQDPGGTSMIAQDSVLAAQGTTWTGALSPQGRLGTLKPDRTSAVADQVEAGLAPLFPVLPPTGLQAGAAWSDSSDRALKTDAFNARERATTNYRVEKVEGKVYTIDAATAFQRTGTAGQSAQAMDMASTGSRRIVYRFGGDGVVLGAEGADSAEMTITVQAVGQTVPVHQRAWWKLSKR